MFRASIGLLLLAAAVAQKTQDQTRVPGAHGSDVVQAVVSQIRDSCIFLDDKLFLRRLAFVASHDGNDPTTYRAGYDGGIWQIDQDLFDQTKSNSKSTALFSAVSSKYAIDWNTVQWSDLRKPLYSGIAAALYLATITEEVPRLMENQGPYYGKYFRVDPNSAHNFYVEADKFSSACTRSNLDLAFLVDSSSSLAPADFVNAKQFASSVVDSFTIGTEDVRVSFMTFSKGYKAVFDFNKYKDKASLKKAIDGVPKTEGGTDTDKALDFATDHLFTSSMGSRDGASKVILLITDGKSNHPLLTVPAALRARSNGIIIYAIGVGDQIDKQELTDAANMPTCTHVIKLAGYSDLSALVSEIQQVSCQAAAVLGPGTYTFQCPKGGLYQFVTQGKLTQVTITVSDGAVDIFGSLENPTPSQAVNSFSSKSTTSAYSVVLINQENKPVYLTVQASGPPDGCTGTYTIKVGDIERVPANTLVSCVERDTARVCSVVNVYGYIYTLLSTPYSFVNPCKPGPPSFQPHPTDQTRFLFCDKDGNVVVFQCPVHNIYDPSLMYCVPGEPITTPPTTQAPTQAATNAPSSGNPCTPENKAAGKFFFPYPPDETKYIDCTNWPTLGYIKDCPPGRVWDQLDLTCTFKKVVINPTDIIFSNIPNPCTNPLRDGDLFYYPHPVDPHKYIHCDQYGDAFEKTCPDDKFWRQELLQCIPDKLHSLFVGKR